MFIIDNPKNSPHCFHPGIMYGSLFPLHGVQPFASDGKALFTILSTPLRQVPSCFTNCTPDLSTNPTLLLIHINQNGKKRKNRWQHHKRGNWDPSIWVRHSKNFIWKIIMTGKSTMFIILPLKPQKAQLYPSHPLRTVRSQRFISFLCLPERH